MSTKTNKLSAGIINSTFAKEFTQKRVILNVGGKDYEVLVDEKFAVSKMNKMVVEALGNYEKLKDYDDGVKLNYYMFMIIKHFTDIDLAKTSDFVEQIRILNAMIDLDIYEPLIKAIPESEITKASDFVKKFSERVTEFLKDNKNIDEVKKMVESELSEVSE